MIVFYSGFGLYMIVFYSRFGLYKKSCFTVVSYWSLRQSEGIVYILIIRLFGTKEININETTCTPGNFSMTCTHIFQVVGYIYQIYLPG